MTAWLDPEAGSLPTWTVDTLSATVYPTWDELGREWCAGTDGQDKGWHSPAAPRGRRTDRSQNHGSYRAAAYRESKQFSLGGYTWCPTLDLVERTRLELAALCSRPGELYEFRRRTEAYDHVRMVELDDEPKIDVGSIYRVDWLFSFVAPDPRKHAFSWQDRIASPLGFSSAALDFTDGLDFASGLDFGTPDPPVTAQVRNSGLAPAYPLLKLTGPCPPFTLRGEVGGWSIGYSQSVDAGETILINLDIEAQRGALGRSIMSSTRGNVRRYASPLPPDPAVPPGVTERISIITTSASSAQLLVSLRSAWW